MSLLRGLAFGALAALVAWIVGASGRGQILEATTYDWRLVGTADPVRARSDIAIIEINESSVRALQPAVGRWPWPRFVHGGVLSFLARARARVVVYDVIFSEPDFLGRYAVGGREISGNDSDAELISAVRRAGNVVGLADAVFQGFDTPQSAAASDTAPIRLPGTTYTPGPGFIARPDVKPPFDALLAEVPALGHNYLQRDDGGVARRMAPFVDVRGVAVPSLGLAAVLLADLVPAEAVTLDGSTLRVGDARLPLVDGQLILNLHGSLCRVPSRARHLSGATPSSTSCSPSRTSGMARPRSSIRPCSRTRSSSSARAPTAWPTCTRRRLAATHPACSCTRRWRTTCCRSTFMRRASPLTDALVTAGTGLAAGAIAMTLPVWWAVGAVVAMAGAVVGAATYAVSTGLWLPVVAPMLAMTLALLLGLSWQYFVEGREKRQVKRLFGRYVSKDVFDRLMDDPSLAQLGGERREMTVLFSDIRGFTSASERTSPEAVVAQLNEYFTAMVEVLFRHHGTLDKFVGDMVMGLFGAPVTDLRHADHAVLAAVEMVARLGSTERPLARRRPADAGHRRRASTQGR